MKHSTTINRLNDEQRAYLTEKLCGNGLDYHTITQIVKGLGKYGDWDLVDVFMLAGKSRRSASILAKKVMKYRVDPHHKVALEITNQIIGLHFNLSRKCSAEASRKAGKDLFLYFKGLHEMGGILNDLFKKSKKIENKFYVCHQCKAQGCKLWRKGNKVYCCVCTSVKAQRVLNDLREDGTIFCCEKNERTNEIGGYIPAVIYDVQDDQVIWGERKDINEELRWWNELPSHPLIQGI